MLFKLFSVVTALSVLAAGVQTYRIHNLKNELVISKVELNACGARLNNILEDKESDDAIDKIPDDGLRHVPDNWLFDSDS